MKFNKTSQLLLVSAASLLAAGALAACADATVDFVFVASSQSAGTNNYGEINIYTINQVSGLMRQIPTSPFPSNGRKPVALAVSQDYTNLYVVNQDDNNIVQFLIGPDGKIYPQNTVNTPGIFPLAVAVSSTYLFVADTYQPGSACNPAVPCSGSVGVFPILTTAQAQALAEPQIGGTLGAVVANPANPPNGGDYWPLAATGKYASDIIVPTGISVLDSGAFLYVSAYDATANSGLIFGFSISSKGILTPLNGSPYSAGTHPSAVAGEIVNTTNSSTGQITENEYVYLTDFTNGNVVGLQSETEIDPQCTTPGTPSKCNLVPTGVVDISLPGSPFAAGNQPTAIAIDPNYPFAFVTNSQDGTVNSYSIGANGVLTKLGTFQAGVDPVAIGIDPGTSHFVFTANFLGNQAVGTVSDFELNTSSGLLVNAQHSPFNSNLLPTAVAAVPHTPSR
ncbi:MAG: beta-propeller fold lactonase family protein [Terracidiphilus sp.]